MELDSKHPLLVPPTGAFLVSKVALPQHILWNKGISRSTRKIEFSLLPVPWQLGPV